MDIANGNEVLTPMIHLITDDTLKQKVLECSTPFLLKFYTLWCAPCKTLNPIFEKLSVAWPRISFGSLNISNNPQTPSTYRISSIPSLLLFNKGEIRGEIRFSVNETTILKMLEKAMVL